MTKGPGFLWENPVIVKEIRTRMRGIRVVILLTTHLLLLGIAIGLAYWIYFSAASNSANLSNRAAFGKALFGVVIAIELIMVSFVSPALTGGAVSSERERQTFDLVRVTRLSAERFVTGKYFSGLGLVLLLLVTSLPLMGPAFSIGGVEWSEVILGVLIVLSSAIAFSALALLLSCLIRRTMINVAITYALTIFLVFGIPVLLLIFLIAFQNIFFGNTSRLSLPLEVILMVIGWISICVSPIATIIASELILSEQHNLFYATLPISGTHQIILPSPWIPLLIFYLLFGLTAILISIQIVRQPEK